MSSALAELREVVAARREYEARVVELATRAHAEGHSWPELARVIGVSRQHLHRLRQRYG